MKNSRYLLTLGWRGYVSEGKIIFSADISAFGITVEKNVISIEGDELIVNKETPQTNAVIEYLKKKNVIVEPSSKSNFFFDSLQSNYFVFKGFKHGCIRKHIKEKKILVLGLGGLGSLIVDQLVSAGIINYLLIDFDIIEQSNLERQLIYKHSDLGKLKTEVCHNHILAKSINANVTTINTRIASRSQFYNLVKDENIDFCCICADQPYKHIFDLCSDALWNLSIPFIFGGVMIESAFWGPVFCRKNQSASPLSHSIWNSSNDAMEGGPIKIAFSPYNSIVANFIAAEVLHYLAGLNDHLDFQNRIFFNFSELKIEKIAPRKV